MSDPDGGWSWVTEAAAGASVIMATTDWAVDNSRGWGPSASDGLALTEAVLSPIADHTEGVLLADHQVDPKKEGGRARLMIGFIGARALSMFDPSAPVIEWTAPALVEDWAAHHAGRGIFGRRKGNATDGATAVLTEIAAEWASPSLARAVPHGVTWADGFRESLAGRLAALVDWWQKAVDAGPTSDAGRFLLRQCCEAWLSTVGRVDPDGVRELAQQHQRDVLRAVRERRRIDEHVPPGRPDKRITLPFVAGDAEPTGTGAGTDDPSDADPSAILSPATVMALEAARSEIEGLLRQPEALLGPLPTAARQLLGVVLRTVEAEGASARLVQGVFTWSFTATLTAIGAEDTVEDGIVDEQAFIDAWTALRRSLISHLHLESTVRDLADVHRSVATEMGIQDLEAVSAQVLLVAGAGITGAAVWAGQVEIRNEDDEEDLDRAPETEDGGNVAPPSRGRGEESSAADGAAARRDFGSDVLEGIKQQLAIEPEHLTGSESETIWRADELPVRLHFFNNPRAAGDYFRVGVSVDMVHNVVAEPDAIHAVLDLLNRECTLGCFRFDAGSQRISADLSWTFTDTEADTLKAFGVAVVLTIFEAEQRSAVLVNRGIGSSPRIEGLPQRVEAAPSLVLANLTFSVGRDDSAFRGEGIESLESGLPWLMAFGSEDELTGQYRYRQDIEPDPTTPQGTTLVTVQAGSHPSTGSGALVRLQAPEAFDDPVRMAAYLNEREVRAGPGALGLGAWCSDDSSVVHVTFVPSITTDYGVLRTVVDGHADRSRWLWHELH